MPTIYQALYLDDLYALSHLFLTTTLRYKYIIIPILQMRKLSNSLTQGHTAGECWSRDSNLGLI